MTSLFPTTAVGASSGAELVTSDGRALPLVATTLRAEAQGGLARYVLEQTYRNAYAETLHVTYRMPLPADGAVSGYAFELAGRVITGVVDRKAAARERFERAIVSGHTAAILEQERQDIFTQQIGNIPANETIVARITVDQRLAWLPEGEWELRFPTVIGPRYIGTADTAADVRATHVKVTDQPLGVTVGLALTIKDAITGGRKATSSSHAIARAEDGTLGLAAGARLDRDLVVRWPVATPEVGLALAVARPAQGDTCGLITIVPPARAAHHPVVARDLLVLLDTSGSMGGGPLDKAKQVVAMMLDSLAETDRFELIEFSNSPRRYKHEPQVASAKAKQDAIKWVRSRSADGGTEMRAAVIEALSTLRIGAQRQVVVVTDGYVGGEHQILQALHERLPRSCRLHVLGVGAAVNRSLATSLARAGRGAEVIVGIDEDAERGAKRLLDRTKQPMLTNVEIMGSALVRHAPEHVPDVFAGAPLVAGVQLAPEGGELIVRGELANAEPWEQRIRVPAQQPGEGNQAIAALFGRERIADLEARTLLDSVDSEIEALGLEYQIATRFTSWIAVDESRVIAKAPERHAVIPQEIPHGTSAAAFGLRRSAPMLMQQAAYDAGESDDFSEELSAEAPQEAYERLSSITDSHAVVNSYSRASSPLLGGVAYDAEAEGGDEFLGEEPTGSRGMAGLSTRAGSVSKHSLSDLLGDGGDGPSEVPPPGMRQQAAKVIAPKRDTARTMAAPPPPEPVAERKEVALGAPAPADKAIASATRMSVGSVQPAQAAQPGPTTPAPAKPGAAGGELLRMRKAEAIAPLRAKRTSPWKVWVMLMLLLALIAALAWWIAS